MTLPYRDPAPITTTTGPDAPVTATATAGSTDVAGPATPTDRLLLGALFVAPILMLAADTLYAARGWDDGGAGVVHVLAAVAYGLAVLCVAGWLPRASVLRAGLILTAVAGAVGNAAYGFEAIHQSFGDTPLVDRSGAASVIKPLGLLFPLSLLLVAIAAYYLGRRLSAGLVLISAVLWPVAHIGNFKALAVIVNAILVVALGTLAWSGAPRPQHPESSTP